MGGEVIARVFTSSTLIVFGLVVALLGTEA